MTVAQKLLLALIPAAYLAGSIPFGLLVGFAKGVDVRRAGSGNIGATNVGRLLGGRYFALALTLDALKGLVPMLVAGAVLGFRAADRLSYVLWLLVGFAAIVGHMFSAFLRFKGGKGVATSTGVVLGLWPYLTLPSLVVVAAWLVVFKLTRIVSISSIIGALVMPIAYVAMGLAWHWDVAGAQLPLLVFAVLIALMILVKHRANIARLRAGTEPRFGRKAGANGSPAATSTNGNGDALHDGPDGDGELRTR